MRLLVAATLAAVAIGVLGAHADADADATKLIGSVDSTATINLEHENGAPVTTLTPGSYDLEVTDSTTDHNFHLTGPAGLDESTEVAGQETVMWSLTLVEGNYHYVSDLHASMAGHVTVVSASPPRPPPGQPQAPPPPPPMPPPPIQHPPPLAPPLAR